MDKGNKQPNNEWPKSNGMTVPEGFFNALEEQVMARIDSLPAPAPVVIAPTTLWHRIRPYTYMAAMFAGIWLMLNMFTLFGGGAEAVTDQHTLADLTAPASNAYLADYIESSSATGDYDLYNDLYESGVDIDFDNL